MPLVPSAYWNIVFGNTPQEVEQDKEGMMVMRTLGRNMSWMLKSFEAGRQTGLTTPLPEKKVRTNFIRKLESDQKDFAPYFTSYNKVDKRFQEED